MACTSCASDKAGTLNDPKWRRALWIALAINGGMFAVEIVAGITGGSKALQADALDFFGDAANYAISLGVAGMAIAWRARAAMLKGATLAVLGLYVLLAAGWGALHSTVPHAEVMGIVGVAALIANLLVAVMLYRFRSGDANMRSVWICSRNDAIGNIAVVLAAGGVFGLNSAWPDLLVAALMAVLGLSGGFQIMRQARAELRSSFTPALPLTGSRYMAIGKLLRRGPMHRLSALFLCFMLMLSLGLGSVAHATEGVRCVDSTSASSLEHSNGDGDQVPADADKAYPHHHGGCHGHHIGVPFEPNLAASLSGLPMAPVAWSHDPMAPVPSDPALRPPQA